MARAAAPFCHSRLSSVEHSGDIARPTVIRAPAVSAPQAALLACPVVEVFSAAPAPASVPRSSRYLAMANASTAQRTLDGHKDLIGLIAFVRHRARPQTLG